MECQSLINNTDTGLMFKYKSFDQSDLHESPQILDIYSVVAL